MKEFISAVEETEANAEREEKIAALMSEGKTREEAEREVDTEAPTEFKLDGRVMHAYAPTTGQLAFMLATMGRGQTDDQRLAGIVNVILYSLRDDDRDYFENRMLERDKKKAVPIEVIEQIFEYLTEQWFGDSRPTQQ